MEPLDPDVARSRAHGALSDDYVKPTPKAAALGPDVARFPAHGAPSVDYVKPIPKAGPAKRTESDRWMRDLAFDIQLPIRKMQEAAGRYAAAVGNNVHTDDNHRHGQNHGQGNNQF